MLIWFKPFILYSKKLFVQIQKFEEDQMVWLRFYFRCYNYSLQAALSLFQFFQCLHLF
ncbi:unnamed protein product [Paramecium primaurelia]|uniref:Uncharacterized protein n=1 Tax=Paramecium primaurelia TaxID=5886 RepID=A0A8S1R060_PARPR|nr:unnamed protein product [Paramecium primaurelia]